MIFWKRKKCPLPKFPHQVAPIFRQLCDALDANGIKELREAVERNALALEEAASTGKAINIQDVRNLTEACFYLLDQYSDRTPEEQALIVGAVRYFAVADDPFDDATFVSGYYDDKRIMNHVFEELGIEESDRYFDVS